MKKNKLILKIDLNVWKNASRDMRELSLYRELGADVAVLAKGCLGDCGKEELVNGFKVLRYNTRPLGLKIPVIVNRIASIFIWAKYVRNEIEPDIISGHDLPGVAVAWISNLFQKKDKKCPVIYDSHEFELGRNEKRNWCTRLIIRIVENYFIKRCVFTIAVNDSIADRLCEEYSLKRRPIVVRSTPNLWRLNNSKIENNRKLILDELGVEFLITYHGIIRSGRGIEDLIKVLSLDNTIGGLIIGDCASDDYYKSLQQLAVDYSVNDRVKFHKAVPLNELSELIGAGDASMILIKPESISYYLSLPNKFFESIQALIPIIASDLPEISKLTKEYSIGLLCNSSDLKNIYQQILLLKRNREVYSNIKKNLLKAKEELCWEKEKRYLAEAIVPLLCEEKGNEIC